MENKDNSIKDAYKSIKTESRGLFKDKGSKFIAIAYPVETEEEIKAILEDIKKEYYDARHHCYAYRLGYKGDKYRANDDGEPSSTAGRPILGQIDSAQLSDILIVVIRYFGGIKLGVPGLIRAYKEASLDAINSSKIIEKIASKRFKLEFDYSQMNSIMNILKSLNIEQSKQNFNLNCSLEVKIRLSMIDDFLSKFDYNTNCKITQIV